MPLRALTTGGKGPLFIWAPCCYPDGYTRPL